MMSDQSSEPPWLAPSTASAGTDDPTKEIIDIDRNPTPEREAEREFTDLDRSKKHLRNRQYEQNIRERKKYALYAYKITKTWVCALIFFVFAQMFLRLFHAGLETPEFVTLVTTTTASVFGFWWLVGKYLFGPDGE